MTMAERAVNAWRLGARRTAAYHPDVERLEFEHPEAYPGMPWMGGKKGEYTRAKLDGKTVATLRWWHPDVATNHELHPSLNPQPEPYELQQIEVHPQHYRKGFGTALYNWTKENAEPNLHFSPSMTDMGKDWAASMGYKPENPTHVPPIVGGQFWRDK